MFICLYINGLIFTGDDSIMFEEFKYVMVKEFKTIDLDLIAYFLGIKVKQCSSGIFISQAKYAVFLVLKLILPTNTGFFATQKYLSP